MRAIQTDSQEQPMFFHHSSTYERPGWNSKVLEPQLFLFCLDSPRGDSMGPARSFRDLVVDVYSQTANPAAGGSARPATGFAHIGADAHLLEAQSIIPDEELGHAMRYHRENDRRTYIYAHALLRLILSLRLDATPRELVFLHGKFGKPALSSPSNSPCFSVAYRNGAIALAVGDAPLGVDLENIRDDVDMEGVSLRFFTKDEQAFLNHASSAEEKRSRFFFVWTRKEALVKAAGVGMQSFPLADGLGSEAMLLDEAGTERSYRTCDLEAPPGYALALSIQSK